MQQQTSNDYINDNSEDWRRRYLILNHQYGLLQQENNILRKKLEEIERKNQELEREINLLRNGTTTTTTSTTTATSSSSIFPQPSNTLQSQTIDSSTEATSTIPSSTTSPTRDDVLDMERRRRQEELDREYAMRLQREMNGEDLVETERSSYRRQPRRIGRRGNRQYPRANIPFFPQIPISHEFPVHIFPRVRSPPNEFDIEPELIIPDIFDPLFPRQRLIFQELVDEEDEDMEEDYEELLRLDEDAVRVGVRRDRLEQLPTHVYHARAANQMESDENSNNACRICFEDYQEGDVIRTLPCMHKFHKNCIDQWLRNHHDCPICKYDVNQ